jgi:TatA/E family protein of Tat protein translocase
MFDIGLQELLVIGVLALLVFGPSKLPELGRMFGRAMREFRRASDEFRSTVETNLKINEEPEPVIAPTTTDTALSPAATETLPSEAEATPAEFSSEAPVAVSIAPFCAQRGSRLYHRSVCDWARRIPEGERVDFASMSTAKDEGLTGCPVCEPWEPT